MDIFVFLIYSNDVVKKNIQRTIMSIEDSFFMPASIVVAHNKHYARITMNITQILCDWHVKMFKKYFKHSKIRNQYISIIFAQHFWGSNVKLHLKNHHVSSHDTSSYTGNRANNEHKKSLRTLRTCASYVNPICSPTLTKRGSASSWYKCSWGEHVRVPYIFE